MTTTNAHVTYALERLTRAMQAADLDTSHLYVQQGSKTYGRAYRLFRRDPETGGLGRVYGLDDYLGMTKAEAVHTLHAITAGVWLVVEADVQANR